MKREEQAMAPVVGYVNGEACFGEPFVNIGTHLLLVFDY
jgi:hypothetical protein